ncbi:DUF2163 domain-containing protein [Alsobacter sp. SYSU M60028]|uniref:DUF2163 domain-containing protein n=1 Tax=Alsobacter ponti TaxID=2962936 RepID=A0ABT1LA12_9HYPH|nr:DUF2163 domain-containing protein [Alsobacter ponti]MCP8937778.1 DUF2163 domain-containing protein [Alsobacter ponti]
MRDLPEGLAAALAGGATTLARCWRLARRDGLTLGFTDHDRDIAFGGLVHAAGTGLEAADLQSELGFAVGGGEVSGALSAPGLAEADLAAGRWDDAAVELWLVDWENPDNRLLLEVGSLGEVRRAGAAFTAELRGLAHRLDETRGRLFQAGCDAELGDARCGVALAAWRGRGVVARTDGAAWIVASGLDAFASGVLAGGLVTFAGGANAGVAVEVKAHGREPDGATLALWEAMAAPIAPGDVFDVTAGCDKSFATCRARFGNGVNFRGFPHIPGNDFVVRVARDGEPGLDGGSLFR